MSIGDDRHSIGDGVHGSAEAAVETSLRRRLDNTHDASQEADETMMMHGISMMAARRNTLPDLDDGLVDCTVVMTEAGRRGMMLSPTSVLLSCTALMGVGAALGFALSHMEPSARTGGQVPPQAQTQQPADTLQVMAVAQTAALGALPQAANIAPAGFVRVAQSENAYLDAGNIFGPAGRPVRVPVTLNGAKMEEYSFLMFRGLPPKVTLSVGFRLKDSWAVSLRDLDSLFLETPEDFEGSFKLEVVLVKGRDTPAESRMITVEILPGDISIPDNSRIAKSAPSQPLASQSPAQIAPGPQVLTAAPRTPKEEALVEREPAPVARPSGPPPQEQAMMQRAETLMRSKDIASARLVYEHLAKNGSARAAFAMAKTYDPAYIRGMEGAGMKPDVAKARMWYQQAADLGNQEAASRLSALVSNR